MTVLHAMFSSYLRLHIVPNPCHINSATFAYTVYIMCLQHVNTLLEKQFTEMSAKVLLRTCGRTANLYAPNAIVLYRKRFSRSVSRPYSLSNFR